MTQQLHDARHERLRLYAERLGLPVRSAPPLHVHCMPSTFSLTRESVRAFGICEWHGWNTWTHSSGYAAFLWVRHVKRIEVPGVEYETLPGDRLGEPSAASET
jgi:hypothetical protein